MSANGGLVQDGAAILLSWPPANYVDPYERKWLVPVVITVWVLGTIPTVLRLYMRARGLAGKFGVDDFLMLAAWITGTALTAELSYIILALKLGRHAWDVPLSYYTHIAYWYFIGQPLFLFCGCFTKVSVLLFYRRLSENATSTKWRIALISCIVFTIAWTLALFLIELLGCRPVQAFWKQFDFYWISQNEFYCSRTIVTTPLAGAFAIVSDAYSTALPCILVYNLQMNKRAKIGLNIVFCIGLLVTVFSIIRTVFIMKAAKESDVTWNIYWTILFIQLEIQVGLGCACLPSMKIFFRRYLQDPIDKIVSTARANRSKRPKLGKLDSSEGSGGSASTTLTEERKNHYAVDRIHQLDVEALEEEEAVTPIEPLIREHGVPEMYHMTPPRSRMPRADQPRLGVYTTSSEKNTTPYSPI